MAGHYFQEALQTLHWARQCGLSVEVEETLVVPEAKSGSDGLHILSKAVQDVRVMMTVAWFRFLADFLCDYVYVLFSSVD